MRYIKRIETASPSILSKQPTRKFFCQKYSVCCWNSIFYFCSCNFLTHRSGFCMWYIYICLVFVY